MKFCLTTKRKQYHLLGITKPKYLGINLKKYVQDLYIEKFKAVLGEIKDNLNKYIIYVHGSKDSIL